MFLEFLVDRKAFHFSKRALREDTASNNWLKKSWSFLYSSLPKSVTDATVDWCSLYKPPRKFLHNLQKNSCSCVFYWIVEPLWMIPSDLPWISGSYRLLAKIKYNIYISRNQKENLSKTNESTCYEPNCKLVSDCQVKYIFIWILLFSTSNVISSSQDCLTSQILKSSNSQI